MRKEKKPSAEKSGSEVCSLKETWMLYKRAILLCCREYPKQFLYVGLHALVKAGSPCFALYFTAQLLNELAGARREEELLKWTAVILVTTLVLSLLKALLFRTKETYTAVQWDCMPAIYAKKMLSMDYSALDDALTYEKLSLVEQLDNWNGNGMNRVSWQYERFLEEFFKLAGGLALSVTLFTIKVPETAEGLSFLNNPFCPWILLVCMLGVAAANATMEKLIQVYEHQSAEMARLGNRIFGFMYDFIFNRKRDLDIRMYRQEEGCVHLFTSIHAFDTKSYFAKMAKGAGGILTALQTVLPSLLMGIVYLYVCLKAWAGAFDVGMITQYVGAVTSISSAITGLFTVAAEAVGNAYYLREVFRFLDIPNQMYQGSLTVEKRTDRNYEIEFQDVSFRYPGAETYALRHVSLKFQIGKRMAVVGQNGSGKTTFIKLLCRLYDPTEGVILLNGIDIRKYNYREYMSIFSIVFQDFQLLSLSLAQNVAAGETFDRERALDCLQKAGLTEMAEKLPRGLDTNIGKDFEEDGVWVSGGEGQKIAIARSLYRDAPFIILDEPTAALDPVAEYEIYSKFNEIVGDRTAVYISHRLSSCRFCDEILVFHEGERIQQGSHEELLADQNGKYAQLWNAQAKYYRK